MLDIRSWSHYVPVMVREIINQPKEGEKEMKTTTELLTIGSKVKVEAEIVESKLERNEIKYKIKVAKTWFTEDELDTCDDEEE